MNDIMLDIETLGTTPGSAILSIAAVRFNLEGRDVSIYNSEQFFATINLKSNLQYGLKIDPDTILWWMDQSIEAREKMRFNEKNGYSLPIALDLFNRWLRDVNSDSSVWGNSNRFDCGLLGYAYHTLANKLPWNHRLERDMRTYIMDHPDTYKPSADRNTIHDPIQDCLYQIEVVQKVYKLKHPQ